MKLAILFPQSHDIVEYTISVIRHLAAVNGHEIVQPDNADLLCISVCDVSQVKYVEAVRKEFPKTKIVVGGHAAIYYRLFGLFANIVNIGQGFDFFKCQSIEEIKSLKSVWHRAKDGEVIESSYYIDWARVPIANVTTQQRYYWGAVGCKNKCKFCMTTWTNPHQQNSSRRVTEVLRRYPNATIVSNDSDEIPSRMTQSIMLRDFLVKPLKKYAVYRVGIEFATEHNRRHYGKPFSDDQFRQAISRAVKEGVRLKLFCIGGIDTKDEWRDLFGSVPPIYQRGNFEIKMTNVMYDMFTPMKRERMGIAPDKMWRSADVADMVKGLKLMGGWPFKGLPCSSPEDTMMRNALCYVASEDDYKAYKNLKKLSLDDIRSQLVERFFLNDYSATVKIDHRMTGQTPVLVSDEARAAHDIMDKTAK